MSTPKLLQTSTDDSPRKANNLSAGAALTIYTPSYAGNSVRDERLDLAHSSHNDPNMAWHLLDSHGLQNQSTHESGLTWSQDNTESFSYLGAQFGVAVPNFPMITNEENLITSRGSDISPLALADCYPTSLDIDLSTETTEDLKSKDDQPLYTLNDSPRKNRLSSNSDAVQDNAELLTYTYKRPCIFVDDDQGQPTMPIADDLYFYSPYDASITPNALVQSAYKLSVTFNKQWTVRLASDFDLITKCTELSTKIQFYLGTNVLRRCFSGTLPSTFKELYAMVYVAFAFSHTIHRDAESCYWDAFSRDVYQWRLALTTQPDIETFVQVWHRLWCPQRFCGPSPQNDNLPSEYYMAINSSLGLGVTSSAGHPAVSQQSSSLRFSYTGQDGLRDDLMGGIVIKGCSRFLDCEYEPICDHNHLISLPAIEYAFIQQRNANFPAGSPLNNSKDLINSIVKPLQRCSVYKTIPEHISNTIDELGQGKLQNMRELEVTLTHYPKV